jgi:3-dehydroquinate synthase
MKQINVRLGERSYPIKIERELILKRGLPKGFVITDSEVYRIYKHLIPENDSRFILASGEDSKSRENYNEVVDKVSRYNPKTIVAFGGGMVGDIAGFVASTFRRGIPFIQIPTTLVAMVDSSIGGKNGVNLGQRKNYLGTFYQPQEILIDPNFLHTLPDTESSNGLAEIIKYSALFGIPSLKKLKTGIKESELEKIIWQCCRLKARLVEKDEFDKAERHCLNFGHTFGHAIELLHNLPHGQAISIGMVYEGEFATTRGLMSDERLSDMIEALEGEGLPTTLPTGIDIDKIIELMKLDKKGELVFALTKDHYTVEIGEGEIQRVCNQIR